MATKLARLVNGFTDLMISKYTTNHHVSSPMSLYTLLALLSNGANKTTLTELYKLLYGNVLDDEGIIKKEVLKLSQDVFVLKQRFQNINATQPQVDLAMVNDFYVDVKVFEKIVPEFMSLMEKNGALHQCNFSDVVGSVVHINKRVVTTTNGLIQNLLEDTDINASTAMVLVNCIYFKPEWMYQFDYKGTKPQPFTSSDNSVSEVQMMCNLEERFYYYKGPNYQQISLPYKSNLFSFDIVLPDTPGDVVNLPISQMVDNLKKTTKVDVHLYLPKFEQETRINYEQLLNDAGFTNMFSLEADFSGIINSSEVLRVDKIVHKAVIKVDEKGTEAAAATAITACLEMCHYRETSPITFNTDHSFQYFIRYVPENMIIFAGQFDNKDTPKT